MAENLRISFKNKKSFEDQMLDIEEDNDRDSYVYHSNSSFVQLNTSALSNRQKDKIRETKKKTSMMENYYVVKLSPNICRASICGLTYLLIMILFFSKLFYVLESNKFPTILQENFPKSCTSFNKSLSHEGNHSFMTYCSLITM